MKEGLRTITAEWRYDQQIRGQWEIAADWTDESQDMSVGLISIVQTFQRS